jgi:hypothetical protein
MECVCTKDLEVIWADFNDTFTLEVYLPNDPRPVYVLIIGHNRFGGQYMITAKGSCYSNPTYGSQLTVNQKEEIKFIAWSRFMRSMGSMLDPFSVMALCDFFQGECQKLGECVTEKCTK